MAAVRLSWAQSYVRAGQRATKPTDALTLKHTSLTLLLSSDCFALNMNEQGFYRHFKCKCMDKEIMASLCIC